eukprot:UN28401
MVKVDSATEMLELEDAVEESWKMMINNLLCQICNDVLEDPEFLECGHTFCCHCIPKFQDKLCPLCRKPFANTKPNFSSKDLLSMVSCTCEYEPNGCPGKIPLSKKKDHFMKCDFKSLACNFDGCNETFLQKRIRINIMMNVICIIRNVSIKDVM